MGRLFDHFSHPERVQRGIKAIERRCIVIKLITLNDDQMPQAGRAVSELPMQLLLPL